MPPIYLFDDSQIENLYPLTYSRSPLFLRCGARTLLQRAARQLGPALAGLLVRDGLAEVTRRETEYPVNPAVSTREGVILVNSRWLMLAEATPGGVLDVKAMAMPDTAGLCRSAIAWIHLGPELAAGIDYAKLAEAATLEAVLPGISRQNAAALLIDRPWDLITHQRAALLADWKDFGAVQQAKIYPGAYLLGPENIYLGSGVTIYPGVVLDAEHGPIILENGVTVQPQSVLTGPLYVGKECVIRSGSQIREECSFGPQCRVGGEVIGSIFLGYSSKQHHGFLGQSVVGQWVNMGAGTTNSNLKNTYGTVRMPLHGVEESTGRQFMGAVLADHVKLGIGTYLSTGGVVGFASQVVCPRPAKFVPSFAWATGKGIERIDFEKTEAVAELAMARRGQSFTAADHELFVRIAGEWSRREVFDWGKTAG